MTPMDQQLQRSMEPITDEQLAHLVELADEDRDRLPAEWRARRAGVFLAQGAAQHFVDGRHGVKDFDVWSFYWADDPATFPWKGPRKRHVDFGESPHGRNVYTAEDRVRLGSRVRPWESFTGRRVDLMTRALRPDPNGIRSAVRDWLAADAGRRWKGPTKMSSAWWISRRPVIELWPGPTCVVWDSAVDLPPGVDPLPPK